MACCPILLNFASIRFRDSHLRAIFAASTILYIKYENYKKYHFS